MAPGLFFEALRREVAGAMRNGTPLSLITFALEPAEFASATEFQEALRKLAFLLRDEMRSEEFFARVSDAGFWVVLKGTSSECQIFLERVASQKISGATSKIFGHAFESYDEWITRIDSEYF